MAYETQMQDHFLDMEASSETDQMLETSTAPARSRSVTRITMLGGIVLGVVLACTVAALVVTRPRETAGNAHKVIGLNSWASILGSDALNSFESAQAIASTTQAPQAAAAAVAAAVTQAPQVAAAVVAAATQAPQAAAAAVAAAVTQAPEAAATTTGQQVADILSSVGYSTATAATNTGAPAAVVGSAAAPMNVSGAGTDLSSLAEQFKHEAASFPDDSQQYTQLMSIYTMLTTKIQTASATAAPATAATVVVVAAASTTTADPQASPLAPHETMNDGNECPDDEEEVAKVCYKKCSDLTGGAYPIRKSPFSCCAAEPCSLSNTKTHMGMCFGFDVAGDSESATAGKCPTSPGACLTDEEEFANMCYKKCTTLTNGAYPHRSAAASCCKTTGLACMLPSNSLTDASYTSGGGAGDGNSGTPAEGHVPMTGLTR